jgi:hypothetical protein
MSEIAIRIGTPNDVDEVMELAMQACDENAFVQPNPRRLLEDIWPALNLDRGLMGIIGEDGQKPQGVVLLRIGKMWYSDQDVVEEKAIFIHPEYRKIGRASCRERVCYSV